MYALLLRLLFDGTLMLDFQCSSSCFWCSSSCSAVTWQGKWDWHLCYCQRPPTAEGHPLLGHPMASAYVKPEYHSTLQHEMQRNMGKGNRLAVLMCPLKDKVWSLSFGWKQRSLKVCPSFLQSAASFSLVCK